MNTYIVLLRGINVGGNNLLPMKDLVGRLTEAGFENVSTTIQSGNVVLDSAKSPENDIAALIETHFGFKPAVLVLSKEAFDLAITNNPYQGIEGKLMHFYFCKQTPILNAQKLEKFSSETESYTVIGDVFYLHAPEGIGRSKLVANIELCLGVSATGRNLNTVKKIQEMVTHT